MKLSSNAHVTLSSELVGEIVEKYLKQQGYTPTGPFELGLCYSSASGATIGFEIIVPVKHTAVVDMTIAGLPCPIPVVNDSTWEVE